MKKIWNFALTFGRACSRSAEKASFFSSHSIAALMAALTVGLSFAVTSCKDDDKDKGNGDGEPTAEEIATDNATTFWGVAANLVSPFDVTVEYEDKTFEPTIGKPLNGNSTIRVVSTGNMSAAAKRFADLTGAEIDENTTTYTYQDDAVGTLTYTKTNDGTSLATVDVNIKQIPHLQQIVYKTPEQMGENGHFAGAAYYSFGDVISLENEDGETEYWVCVRPAIGDAGKEDTHWVTLSPLPEKNIWTYQGKKKPITFKLPTNLSKNYEHMQNLAELLYAICNPEQWWQNLQDNRGIDLFHDLNHERAKYFNQYFWQIVQNYWKDNSEGLSIFERLFGYNFDNMKDIINNQNALHLLYYGFKWRTTTSNSPTLYEYTYSNGAGNRSNMHDKKYRAVSKNVMTGDGIELNCEADYAKKHWIMGAFFGDTQPRFIFRFATGKDLFGSDPGVFQSMTGGKHHIKDFYVLNQKLGNDTFEGSKLREYTASDVTPDEVLNKGNNSMGVYLPGDVVKDEEGNRWICIAGSGYWPEMGFIDDRAWFISFEGIKMGNDGDPINILTEAQAPEVGIRLISLMQTLTIVFENSGLKFKGRDELGDVGKQILKYGKVNIADLLTVRDSVWRFKDNESGDHFDSRSRNWFNNIAYLASDNGSVGLLRCIFDYTQAGTERTSCNPASGKGDFKNQQFNMYKHYQNSDPKSWRPLTPDESSLEMTQYMLPWPLTDTRMTFYDLGSQSMVERYAAKDKWVTLPLTNLAQKNNDPYNTKREEPRTSAYQTLKVENFIKSADGSFTDHLGMFNEPVLFLRVMTVKDAGGNKATLVSEDGRRLTVVHLMDNANMYDTKFNYTLNQGLRTIRNDLIFLDNEAYNMDFRCQEIQ